MKCNIAICDDEQDFVTELEEMIQKYVGETGIEIRTATFKNGLKLIECNRSELDLIFLNI